MLLAHGGLAEALRWLQSKPFAAVPGHADRKYRPKQFLLCPVTRYDDAHICVRDYTVDMVTVLQWLSRPTLIIRTQIGTVPVRYLGLPGDGAATLCLAAKDELAG